MHQSLTAIGRIGRDVETRRLENGVAVSKTTIAVTKSWKDKEGNKKEETTWLNLVFWKGLSDVVEKYVKKGDLIFVQGEISNREYEKDGVKKYFTEIVCNEMKMLGGKKDDGGSFPTEEPPRTTPETVTVGTEPTGSGDLPF